MQLPDTLKSAAKELEKALAVPFLAAWPMTAGKDDSFAEADQPEAIAQVLIEQLHEELATARIAYLFKKDMVKGDKVKLGSAKRAGGQLHFLTEYDFLITINWSTWAKLTGEQRIALMDHELSHCGKEDEKYVLVSHDVEEFGSIVRRWGLWQPDLRKFAVPVVEAASQTDLFAAPAGEIARALDNVASIVDGEHITSLEISSGGRKLKLDKTAADRIHAAAESAR